MLSFYIQSTSNSRLKKFKHTNEELELAKLETEKLRKKKSEEESQEQQKQQTQD